MRIIAHYLRPYYWRMACGFIIKLTGTIMDLLLPWILAYIIDEVVPEGELTQVMLWGFAMIICAILAVLGNVIANRMASAVARDTTRTIRNELFAKIQQLSCSQVSYYTESSLISRMTSDTYNVHHVIGMMQRLGVRAPILLLGGIAVTLTLDPVMALILVAMLPFLGLTVFYVSKKGIPLYQLHQNAADRMISKVRESITGIRVLKALSKVEYEKRQFQKINADVSAKETRAGVIMAITNPVMNFLLNMGWVLIIIIGAYRIDRGLTEPGKIIAFLTYFTIILNAMLSITRLFVMFSKAGSSAERIKKVMEAPEELAVIYDGCSQRPDEEFKNNTPEQRISERPYIEFEQVTFSYNKRYNNLENVNFQLQREQTLGIIGATGSGKTTIINLLLRIYDADRGIIRINGRDIRTYEAGELHELFGVVFQNDMIFEDSIRENITLGRDIIQEDIEKAAQSAQLSDFIESMKDGYEYRVAIKGANLSGGQRQRLLIARALAKEPEILILDDSSSALDYKTDAAVRKAIRDNYSGSTSIIVAQRVSSVMNADIIIVMDEGRIVGTGTHDELMEKCAEYSEISRLQMDSI